MKRALQTIKFRFLSLIDLSFDELWTKRRDSVMEGRTLGFQFSEALVWENFGPNIKTNSGENELLAPDTIEY